MLFNSRNRDEFSHAKANGIKSNTTFNKTWVLFKFSKKNLLLWVCCFLNAKYHISLFFLSLLTAYKDKQNTLVSREKLFLQVSLKHILVFTVLYLCIMLYHVFVFNSRCIKWLLLFFVHKIFFMLLACE